MNLRELLLQFAGENDKTLQLEDFLLDEVSGIDVESEVGSKVKVLVCNPSQKDTIMERIKSVLEKHGYEEYTITPIFEGEVCSITVEI